MLGFLVLLLAQEIAGARREVHAAFQQIVEFWVAQGQHNQSLAAVADLLRRIDAVPMGMLAARKQKVDRGRCRAIAINDARVTKCLAEMSAFGMRLQRKVADHVGGG